MNSIYACASAFLRNSICENVIALTPAGDQTPGPRAKFSFVVCFLFILQEKKEKNTICQL